MIIVERSSLAEVTITDGENYPIPDSHFEVNVDANNYLIVDYAIRATPDVSNLACEVALYIETNGLELVFTRSHLLVAVVNPIHLQGRFVIFVPEGHAVGHLETAPYEADMRLFGNIDSTVFPLPLQNSRAFYLYIDQVGRG